jgi:hypothetical protein
LAAYFIWNIVGVVGGFYLEQMPFTTNGAMANIALNNCCLEKNCSELILRTKMV